MYKVVINQIIDQIGYFSEFDHPRADTIKNSILSFFKTATLKSVKNTNHYNNWLSHPIIALARRWAWGLWLVVSVIQSLITPHNNTPASIIKPARSSTLLSCLPIASQSLLALLVSATHFHRSIYQIGRSAIYDIEVLENTRSLVNRCCKPHQRAYYVKRKPSWVCLHVPFFDGEMLTASVRIALNIHLKQGDHPDERL